MHGFRRHKENENVKVNRVGQPKSYKVFPESWPGNRTFWAVQVFPGLKLVRGLFMSALAVDLHTMHMCTYRRRHNRKLAFPGLVEEQLPGQSTSKVFKNRPSRAFKCGKITFTKLASKIKLFGVSTHTHTRARALASPLLCNKRTFLCTLVCNHRGVE